MRAEVALVPVFFLVVMYCLYCFDQVLKTEYLNHREQWLADGSPLGMFWAPKGASLFSGSISRLKLSVRWLVRNPQWAAGDMKARQHLRTMRVSWAVASIAWLILVARIMAGP